MEKEKKSINRDVSHYRDTLPAVPDGNSHNNVCSLQKKKKKKKHEIKKTETVASGKYYLFIYFFLFPSRRFPCYPSLVPERTFVGKQQNHFRQFESHLTSTSTIYIYVYIPLPLT